MSAPRLQQLSPTFKATAIGLAAGLLFGALHLAGALGRVENLAYDLRFRACSRPELASDRVVIVALDNASFEAPQMLENFGRWPWHRNLYAQLLWYLRKAPARAIAIDITLAGRDVVAEPNPNQAPPDKLLAAQLEEKRDTVLAFSLGKAFGAETLARPDLESNAWTVRKPSCGPRQGYTSTELSLPELNEKAAALGCISVEKDADGVLRRAPLLFRYGGRFYPSLSLAVVTAAAQPPAGAGRPEAGFACDGGLHLPGREVPTGGPNAAAYIYWYGPYRTFRHYSVWDVFNSALAVYNGEKPAIAPEEFRDKIVLIGPTATSIGDLHATPFSPVYPGVEMHATVISNLLQGHFVRPASPAWELLAILVLALGASVAVWRFADWRAYTLAAVLLAGGFVGVNFWLFRGPRIALVLAAPLGALVLSYATGNVSRYITEGREKKRYRTTLMKYVAPQIVEAIMANPRMAGLQNEKLDLTVLFSDVRGFTSISEKIPVNELVATLNEFLNEMVAVIFRNGGTLDKFVGDCVMAIWGAPVRQENHAELAARTALEMQAALDRLNQKWRRENRPELKIGVGLNTGEVIFGNIGSEQRMDFTVIGDNVNLASRLESATKELKASIVISEATYQRIASMAEVRDLGTIHVKGKDVPIRVYELLGMARKETEQHATAHQ